MSSVATWMARLDEKDNKMRRQREVAVKVPKKLPSQPPVEQQTSKKDDNNELNDLVDLCSDGEETDSLDSFDTETVLSQSSVTIIDDDLGEVNLKDFADHVEGKLDLKPNKQKKQNNAKGPIVKFLVSRKPDALRRSLKTYANRRKSTAQAIGEALSEAMQDPKILREVNGEASREAGQKSKKSDCLGPKVDKEVNPDGNTTLVAASDSQQKLQIVTEPTAYYNFVGQSGVEEKLRKSELETKSEPEVRTNAKENEPKKGFNLQQAVEEITKEMAHPKDSSINEKSEQDNHAPQIRIRTDLGNHQKDVIRVRTDLLLEQPPKESLNSLGNQSPSAETLVPERTAKKRILSEAQSSQQPPKRPALEPYSQYASADPSSCQPSISITPVYPTSTQSYQGNPAPVRPPPINPTPVRPPHVNPAPAPPVVTVKYKLLAPKHSAPVTSVSSSTTTSGSYQRDVPNSCQPKLPSTTTHNHNSVNSASASSSGYPSGSHMCPVTSTSNQQPNNPANVTAMPGGAPIVDPNRTDLASILDMLRQVELFAYTQENREAFHLVGQLRNSLQRGAAFGYRR
ncbi:hypothetical protein KR054_005945 [Drosophila jambulina]|nr:hypothetical protein KR054_005945 [Drosophila jambulina]